MSKDHDFGTQYGYMLSDRDSTGLTTSMEDYIETIYRLSADVIRVNLLAVHLHVTPSAVSRMAEQLKRKGLIKFERYGYITLTDEGKETAAFLLWRHDTVKRLLEQINGDNTKQSEIDLIKHHLSPTTVKNIERFLEEYIEQ